MRSARMSLNGPHCTNEQQQECAVSVRALVTVAIASGESPETDLTDRERIFLVAWISTFAVFRTEAQNTSRSVTPTHSILFRITSEQRML